MVTSRKFAGALARAGTAALVAMASPLSHAGADSYFIDFTGGTTRPDVGLFTYDSGTSTFLNFQLAWNGHVYDLTSAANAPVVGSGCAGLASSGATGFALMSKSLCAGLYDRWAGISNFGSTSFQFSSQTLALPERSAARISADGPGLPDVIGLQISQGDWSLGAPFSAPAGTPTILPNGQVLFPGGSVYLPGKGLLPINYMIQFTGGVDLPSFGFFNYDKSTQAFSNFYVEWQGIMFDLSAAANAPSIGSACPGTAASGAASFSLMSKSLCGGLYDRWTGISDFGATTFSFSSQTLALPEQNAARISTNGPGLPDALGLSISQGDWILIPIAAVPEASTLSCLLLGLLALLPRASRRARSARVRHPSFREHESRPCPSPSLLPRFRPSPIRAPALTASSMASRTTAWVQCSSLRCSASARWRA